MNNKFDALQTADSDSDSDDRTSEVKASPSSAKITILPGEHPLQYTYCFWFSKRMSRPSNPQTFQSFEKNMTIVGTFATVEQFWKSYSHMIRPGDLSVNSDIHIFKHGIKPLWEDKSNKNGGKWIIRLKKGVSSRCWENLILAMLGEQFMVGDEICGAVVSIRYQEDIISIWNKSSNDTEVTSKIRDTLRRVLNVPTNTIMEYKKHSNSIRDKSSFRNTEMFSR